MLYEQQCSTLDMFDGATPGDSIRASVQIVGTNHLWGAFSVRG